MPGTEWSVQTSNCYTPWCLTFPSKSELRHPVSSRWGCFPCSKWNTTECVRQMGVSSSHREQLSVEASPSRSFTNFQLVHCLSSLPDSVNISGKLRVVGVHTIQLKVPSISGPDLRFPRQRHAISRFDVREQRGGGLEECNGFLCRRFESQLNTIGSP